MKDNLDKIESKLLELKNRENLNLPYRVPALWLECDDSVKSKTKEINPLDYFIDRINRIKKLSSSKRIKLPKKDWTKFAIIYNMLIRHATAFDHDNDGKLINNNDGKSFLETGSFLKAISILPYIYSLGVNTIYLLPITSIGNDSKKGTLGSPYAIRNPYKLDNNLSEPILEMDIETQFNALVEAAHLLGMKVVLEFVFRTASIDSDWALEHPEWFYWLNTDECLSLSDNENKYGPPIFNDPELELIKEKILNKDFSNLPEPHQHYKDLFSSIPVTIEIKNGKIIGRTAENKICHIASAFADWPPDDTQPVWSDVTYLRLFNNPNFNYIAYNTVRMYDDKLNQAKYNIQELWENISNIVPFYQEKFNIDGVMVDMGHALPSALQHEIIGKARRKNKHFMFWEENFNLAHKSVNEGYDAVVGYMMFDEHKIEKLKELLIVLSTTGSPIPFFATAENHNTPRAVTRIDDDKNNCIKYSKLALLINMMLPAIPFIHSGFELGEKYPVNTGLDFSQEELIKYPAEKLPLFSESALCWNSDDEFTDFIKYFFDIREKYLIKHDAYNPKTMIIPEVSNENIIAFLRESTIKGTYLLICGSYDKRENINIEIQFSQPIIKYTDLTKKNILKIENKALYLQLSYLDFQCGLIEFNDL